MKTTISLLLLALAGCLVGRPAHAQTTAVAAAPAGPKSVMPNPPPPPVLPEHPTAAQRAEYERQSLDYERRRWNYLLTDSTARARILNEQPNALLMETVKTLKPGKALDVAMGEGRNAIYLAQQGWQVTGVDIADQAIAFAQKKAVLKSTRITTVLHDVDTYDWGTAQWDLIVLSYAGGREYAPKALKALKPGGLLVLEGFHRDATKDHKIGADVVFDTDELKKRYAAAGLKIVRYAEPLAKADFGKYEVRLVQLVAQKPL